MKWSPRPAKDDVPLSALVFKIVTDPYVGRLAYFRVYSGKITQGSTVYNSTKGKRERVGRLLRMYADRREDIAEILAGDIAAVLGMKETFTGDTLCDAANPVVLENISFPEPVIFMAIEPKTTADQSKMSEAMQKLSEEDPTFRVSYDDATGQTVVVGHGRIAPGSPGRSHAARVQGPGQHRPAAWPTARSISAPVPKSEYRYIKQTGGHGQYGHVVLSLEPSEPRFGYFLSRTGSSAAPSRASTSRRLRRVCARRPKAACWPAIR